MSATFLTDLANTTVVGESISAATAQTTNANGASVDLQLTDGPIAAFIDVTSMSGTTFQTTVQLQTSSGNGTWTNIASEGTQDNALAGSLTVSATGCTFISSNQRLQRYVRAITTNTTGATSMTMTVAILGRKKIVGTGAGNWTNSKPGSGF